MTSSPLDFTETSTLRTETSAHAGTAENISATECPCGSHQPYTSCCGVFHRGEGEAATAEALMRSRYSAYALHDADYLNKTHHPSTLDADLKESLKDSFERCVWTGLKITGRKAGSVQDKEGHVRFEASFRQGDKHFVLKEHSRFVHEDGRWFYVDGQGGIEPAKVPLPGRNDPCWCGSGKKFKKCHAA